MSSCVATTTTQIYTLSLHDALPISTLWYFLWYFHGRRSDAPTPPLLAAKRVTSAGTASRASQLRSSRSEEHTSELQSPVHLVCRLLLEKKKKPTQCLAI